ncbi:DNA excision repair protein ERCC-6-like [Saccostrea echinata]|uniref:DNA excision repair protein ERCC-6-like n=1 Tax=Saccostrea echinata TaxID=191078 RepID=UPI002A811413|nr:DNA excision repair protein ERCC-6-like [Saccostrea echinata]
MEDDACQGLHNLSISEESTLAQCIQEKYSRLILQSKELVSQGNVHKALQLNKTAYRLCPSDKLQRKIQRMQAYIEEISTDVTKGDEKNEVNRTPSLKNENERTSPSSSVMEGSPSQMDKVVTTVSSPSVPAMQNLSEEDQVQYAMLISEAGKKVEEKKIPQALYLNRKALKIAYSDKLQRKIQRMELYIQQNNLSELSDSLEKTSEMTNSEEKQIPTSVQSSVPKVMETSDESSKTEEEEQSKFARLVSEAKDLTSKGQVKEALDLYKEAAKICPSDKLSRKMERMEDYLRQNTTASDSSEPKIPKETGEMDVAMETADSCSTKGEISPTDPAAENQYTKLVSRAKDLTENGHVKEALCLYRLAAEIKPSDKLTRKMQRMEDYLKQNGMSVDDVQPSKAETIEKTPTEMECEQGGQSTENVPPKSTDRDVNDLSEEDQVRFATLVSKAKEQTLQGRAAEALQSYKQAAEICPSNKLQGKIQKLETFLKESQKSDVDRNVNVVKTPMTIVRLLTEGTPKRRSSSSSQSGAPSVDQQKKYNDLVVKAKKLATDGKIREALECNKKALAICFSEKLKKRIQKMESYLASNDDEDDEEPSESGGMVHMGNSFYLYKDLVKNLYAHQKQGVMWMWGLHQKRKGGILGDDMGLGKTIQVIAFLSGLFDMQKVHSVMIVMPVSVIGNWDKELKKWAPGIKVESYHGSKKEKERSLAKIRRKGGILLTSYGLIVTSWEMMSQQDGRPFKWDYLILDEGHKIKNPTKTTKGVHQIPASHRILLTGTPIQNNLREMWSLFDFVHQGTLLGTARTFKMEFDTPITRARERDATANERRLGMEMAESLKQIISPYFLRRTKAEVIDKEEKDELDVSSSAKSLKMPSMTRKNDLILWLFLTPDQQRIYSDFLSLDSVKELLMTKKSPLVALTVLKKICDHPRLLSRRACAQLGLDGEHALDDSALESEEGHQCAANEIKNMPDNVLIQESGKLIVIMDLLDQMKREGHRCLVFSQSRKMLDIIQQLISNRGHKVMRLDGTITQLSERDRRIATFQEDMSYSAFLLTTQVGGVGLTLTAADRVIIYDPSWNPATDAQAVDRVFRIGQDKNVVIYRLITCGTVEEKIYRRQIFKDSITRQTTGNSKNPYRYFTKQELRELFTLDNPRISKTQQQLEEMHSHQRNTDSSLDAHIAFLYSLEIFGISDHDLMFTREKCDFEDNGEAEVEHGEEYIQHRVQKAKELLQMESDLTQDFEQRTGKYQRNVPAGPEDAGSQKPFSRPWADWNLQGTVNTQEEEDAKDVQEIDLDAENVDDDDDEEEEEDNDVKEVKAEVLETSHIDLVTPEPTPIKGSNTVVDLTAIIPGVKVKTEPELNKTDIQIENEQNEMMTEVLSPGQHVEKAAESDEDVQTIENLGNLSIKASPKRTSLDKDSMCMLESDSNDRENNTSNNGGIGPKSQDKDGMQTDEDEVQTYQDEIEDVEKTSSDIQSNESENDKMEESIIDSEDDENKENVPLSQIIASAKRSSDAFKLNRSTDGQARSPLAPILISPAITDSPAKKKPRRSVSQSPWLTQPHEKKVENTVREEEVFISPDRFRPLMGTKSKDNSDLLKSRSNLNATILSAFSDSPQPGSSPLGRKVTSESFLERKRTGSKLQETLLGESPDQSGATSRLEKSFVPNSLQNTPDVSLSAKDISGQDSIAIEETDEESSPAKYMSISKSESVVENSMLSDEEKHSSDSDNCKPSNNQSKIEIDSEDDLPTFSVKKKSVKKAVIVSDSESDTSDVNPGEEAQRSMEQENRNKRKSSESNSLSQSKYAMLSSSDNEQAENQEDLRSEESGNNEDSEDIDEDSIDIDVDSEDEDFLDLAENLKEQYLMTVKRAKELYKSRNYEECLANALQALEIYPENTALQAFALMVNSKMEG